MISTYALKRSFQKLLRPLAHAFLKHGVTPNQVTAFTVLLSVAVGILISQFAHVPAVFAIVPIFLFVRMALNAIDGMMAREGGLESPLGVFLNELGDVVSDLALFFAFCATGSIRLEPLTIFALLAVLSEMAGVVAVQVGAPRSYEGPMGKSDRAVLMGLVGFLLFVGIQSSVVYDVILDLGSLALLVTIVNRVRRTLSESKIQEGKVKNYD